MKRAAGVLIATVIIATLPCRAGEPAPAAAGAVTIRWNVDAGRFEVSGVSSRTLDALRAASTDARAWPQRFGVYVDAGKPAGTPLLGVYAVEDDAVTFRPRFALRPGMSYRATFKLDGEHVVDAVVELPAEPQRPATSVAAIYPGAAELPENLLKFYIHFTAPMSRGEAYQRLHVVDVTDPAAPREVPDAFLRLGEELWDAEGRRFTLLFDPGRIKRGLVPNQEMGTPLVAGRRYALVVDDEWRDANGQPLAGSHRKEFVVTPLDDVQPNPSKWSPRLPAAATSDSIRFGFNEPLDHALASRCLKIRDAAGNEVVGQAETIDDDAGWSFTPERPWAAGEYELVVDPILEDLAGNSVGRAFETRAGEEVDQGTHAEAVWVPFTIASPAGL